MDCGDSGGDRKRSDWRGRGRGVSEGTARRSLPPASEWTWRREAEQPEGREGLCYECVDVSTEQVGCRKGGDPCHMARHMKEVTLCHRLNCVPQPQIHMLKS